MKRSGMVGSSVARRSSEEVADAAGRRKRVAATKPPSALSLWLPEWQKRAMAEFSAAANAESKEVCKASLY